MTKKPDWLRIRYAANPNHKVVEEILSARNLATVCREAACPNYAECFANKTATFLILGTACTRNCRFCNVHHAEPQPVVPDEPMQIAEAVAELGLAYVVVTSVTRDDLPDGGAGHFAAVIRAIKQKTPQTAVEVLIPDFQGDTDALKIVMDAVPDVISHNMETVSALYSAVRPQAEYAQSLAVLQHIKTHAPHIHTKSGIMLGLGETRDQVLALFDDLRAVECDFLTVGQYLAPTKAHHPIQAYITPDEFTAYGDIAREKGFSFVASAPLVRSSFHAGEALNHM